MLNIPTDVVVDMNGNVYISDSGNALIRKVDQTTRIITNFVGNTHFGFSGDNGHATSASIGEIFSLTLDPLQQNLYITATFLNRIRKVDLATNIITTFAGTGDKIFNGENILASMVHMFYVSCVRFDANGDFLFYIDYLNTRIRKINMKTNIVTTVAGNGNSGYNGDNIEATSASISNALSLTIDLIGNVYFSDTYNNRVRKVDSNTVFFFFFFF
jgi:sugar lactone lactonase YvrE